MNNLTRRARIASFLKCARVQSVLCSKPASASANISAFFTMRERPYRDDIRRPEESPPQRQRHSVVAFRYSVLQYECTGKYYVMHIMVCIYNNVVSQCNAHISPKQYALNSRNGRRGQHRSCMRQSDINKRTGEYVGVFALSALGSNGRIIFHTAQWWWRNRISHCILNCLQLLCLLLYIAWYA